MNETKHSHGKDFEVSLLLDFYGELLSGTKREAAELYYNEDFSLAEIAENIGITRQGVRDSIEKAKAQLYYYEEKLGLAGKMREINLMLANIMPRLENLREASGGSTRDELNIIIEEVKKII